MAHMLQIQVDQHEVKKLYEDAIDKHLEKIDNEKIYWDSKELKRRVSMSWGTILEHFFSDPNFPKVKIGGKWYFHAERTKEYLNKWFEEKNRKD
jgi:phage pi2 protein 07